MNHDHAIVAVVSGLAIALHVVLFVLIRRWMDRDLALSFAGDDPGNWLLNAQRDAVGFSETASISSTCLPISAMVCASAMAHVVAPSPGTVDVTPTVRKPRSDA